MDPNGTDKIILAKRADLRRHREKILSLPPEKALQKILDRTDAAPLVHSFSEEDLYFLVHDLGPQDALPLIRLASNRQWTFMIDAEAWEKDRLNLTQTERWLELLLRADPERLIQWVVEEIKELFEFYLSKNIELRIREHDQDPSDFGRSYFTFDDKLYIKILDSPDERVTGKDSRKKKVIKILLKRLASYDYVTFQGILLESSCILPAETEEEEYRLRNVRLAEKGFLPFDEAVGIYQPIAPEDLTKRRAKVISKKNRHEPLLPVPILHSQIAVGEHFFGDALTRIEPERVLDKLRFEFAGLCNRIISADQDPIRHREQLRAIVEKACGYINIGIQRLLDGPEPPDPNHTAALVKRFPLSDIFRVGFGQVLELKWRAERWRKQSWFELHGLSLSFWGEHWLGVLGGLLLKKPKYFDNYKTGVLYREFRCQHEVEASANVLDDIMAFDGILSLMQEKISGRPDMFLTYKNLVLTLWARRLIGLSETLSPLTPKEFKKVFHLLWTSKRLPRRIRFSIKMSFLNWLSGRTGLMPFEISERVGGTIENLFNEIESEYGQVSIKDLDPRYILLFIISR